MADGRLELAYDAAKSKLSQQDGTLGTIRNRATSLFTAAALAVSFTAAIGLISGDGELRREYPIWMSIALLVVLTLMATAVMAIQWPARGFHFGPSVGVILEKQQAGEDEDAIRLYVARAMAAGGLSNARVIKTKQRALRLLVGLLWLEIVLIIIAVVITT